MNKVRRVPRRCDEKGCKGVAQVWCFLPGDYTPEGEEFDGAYCSEHAEQNGFCRMCGQFWAGVESFHFGTYHGYCDNCRYEVEREEDLEYDEWEDSDYYEPPQEAYVC